MEVVTLTETRYVGLWTQLPGQGKEILTGHLLQGRKIFQLLATVEVKVQITNIKQSLNKQESKCNSIHWSKQKGCSRYMASSDKGHRHLGGSPAAVNRLN